MHACIRACTVEIQKSDIWTFERKGTVNVNVNVTLLADDVPSRDDDDDDDEERRGFLCPRRWV